MQSSILIMTQKYEEFISLTLRTRNSRRPSRILARNWKHQGLPLCLAKSARTVRIVVTCKLACILEVSDSPRPRMGESLPNHHEDHIAGKGDNSLQHYNLVTNLFPCFKPWKFPRQRQQWTKMKKWRKFRRGTWRKRSKKEVIDEARTKGARVHFVALVDMCHLKNAELEAKHQKYKSRVVLRGDIVKDDSGSYAVLTEQGSSASQMTSAKVMDIMSRLPSCAGQATDAVSVYEDARLRPIRLRTIRLRPAGRNRIGRSRNWPKSNRWCLLCFFFFCFLVFFWFFSFSSSSISSYSSFSFCSVGPHSVGPPPPDPPPPTPLRRTPQNFALFFPSPATIFSLSSFFPLLGGPFVEFWCCLKRRDPQMPMFLWGRRKGPTLANPVLAILIWPILANSILDNPFLAILVLARPILANPFLSVCHGGPWKVGPRTGEPPQGPEGRGPEGWGSKMVGGPKISLFFFPSPATISLFLCLSGCLLVVCWWCFRRSAGAWNVHVWSSRCFTRQPESPNVHILGSFKNTIKNQREDPQERQKKNGMGTGEGKKERNFGRSGGGGGPAEGVASGGLAQRWSRDVQTNNNHNAKPRMSGARRVGPRRVALSLPPLPGLRVWVYGVWGSGLLVFGSLGFLGSENLAKTVKH